ncbi:nuclear transport factor 2 family protein [Paraburkholderia unamae]|uniref:Uncharacterized protein DUF4440 n=1 Tax=Paraburkholderia unamae TaxID=219649 RepID=A0ABX5KSW3_9BURK|nr:nuclear transport factor 2 family protein [Paraburkholderia unamae]PVX84781.1 uncharacterized protein DUF4440 [Paraburkholderia unamae]CAG9271625.1 hypothetical protein PUN4_660008 [Paraburkholderia unamae]
MRADEAQDRAAILALEQRRQAALVAVDLDALDELFADDLVHVHSTGLVHDKAALLRHIERKRGFIAIERGPLALRVDGDIAVMTGPLTNRMRAPHGEGEIAMHAFVTQVLRRRSGRWQFTNFHLTITQES